VGGALFAPSKALWETPATISPPTPNPVGVARALRRAVMARGYPDPMDAYPTALGTISDYPEGMFEWAANHHVDLGDEIAVLEKVISIAELSDTQLSKEEDKRIFRCQLELEIARSNQR